MLMLDERDKILFIGDSITDCGRDKASETDLGQGYPRLISALLGADYPELDLTFINKGISGNRVKDLKSRWEDDCIKLEPNVISILIGINDTWRKYDSNDPTSVEAYKDDYHAILEQATSKLDCQLILLEPFVLPCPDDRKAWREDLDPKIQAARELAREFNADYVPLDGIFAYASCRQSCEYWAADGVHPSLSGHGLIANAWLEYAGLG